MAFFVLAKNIKQRYYACIRGALNAMSLLLRPLSFTYSFAMKLRRLLFKKGLLNQLKQNIPTISVGNISWGGTGKTPLVEFLGAWALDKKIKPIILTRGYGGKPSYTPLVVNPAHKAKEVGDEPLMLADSLPLAPVVVDPQRKKSMKYCMEKMSPSLFILDDGFQHLYVDRHLDLVLLNYNDLQSGFNKVIPEGTWREPASALKNADAFIIKTKMNDWDELCKCFDKSMEKYKKPFFGFSMQVLGLVPSVGQFNIYPPQVLKDSPYAFVTGIGSPSQAYKSVIDFMGRPPSFEKFYPDHHDFSLKDGLSLVKLGMPIICTHKDAVKLKSVNVTNLWYIKSRVCFGASYGTDLSFNDWLDAWWKKQEDGVNTDKTGMSFENDFLYEGDEESWGVNSLNLVMPNSYLLPAGWGPAQKINEPQRRKVFSSLFAQDMQFEKPPENIKGKDVNYAFTLADNVREAKQQEAKLARINKQVKASEKNKKS